MPVAGILLTGGSSRRMGRDKATLASAQFSTFSLRTAALLEAETALAVEVGPGFTELPRTAEDPPGRGPLAALVAGVEHLSACGWEGPVLLVATDLPRLTPGMLRWLAVATPGRSVVPIRAGRPQPLCARYEPDDLRVAGELVAAGRFAMKDLLTAVKARNADEDEWGPAAGGAGCLDDVDTPDDLAAFHASVDRAETQ